MINYFFCILLEFFVKLIQKSGTKNEWLVSIQSQDYIYIAELDESTKISSI